MLDKLRRQGLVEDEILQDDLRKIGKRIVEGPTMTSVVAESHTGKKGLEEVSMTRYNCESSKNLETQEL
jgi:hypothetical protein